MTESTVRSSGRRWLGVFLGVVAAGLCVHLLPTTAAWAQGDVGHADIATFRTIKEMQDFDAAHSNLPESMSPSLTTMDFGQYQAMKATSGPVVGGARQGGGNAPLPEAPPTLGGLHCNGLGQNAPVTGNHFPPDTHAAIGANHFGQVVNAAVRFSTKALTGNCPTNAAVINVSLAAFFSYATQPLFDPRIVYDLTYGRWIVSAEAFPESATVQKHFIAVSVSSDPTAGFLFQTFNVITDFGIGNGVFWDYPQIGYDEEAIALTGNKFQPSSGDPNEGGTYTGSTVIFLPKHRLYAGLGFDFCFFNGPPWNVGTIAPNIVLDQSPYTTLATAVVASNSIRVYKFLGTSHACPTFLGSNDIATTTFVPPAAEQPGSGACPNANCLDTLDGRFQNAGTQFGEPCCTGGVGAPVRFWQIRDDQDAGLPTPLSYKINADTLTIEESCEFFGSATGFSFNPAIVANESGTIFTTWSETDPTNGFNAQVRISGKLTGDACTVAQTGLLVNQSANPLTNNLDATIGLQRWGDYSAVTLDPADHTTVWGINEKVQASAPPTTWKAYIFNMHNP